MGKGGQGRQGGENQDVHLGRNWRTKALIGGGEGTADLEPQGKRAQVTKHRGQEVETEGSWTDRQEPNHIESGTQRQDLGLGLKESEAK